MPLKINTIKSHIFPLFGFPGPRQRPYWFYLTISPPPLFASWAFSTHWMLIKQQLLSHYAGVIQPRDASMPVSQWTSTGLLGKYASFQLSFQEKNPASLKSSHINWLGTTFFLEKGPEKLFFFFLSIVQCSQRCNLSKFCNKNDSWYRYGGSWK